MTKENSVKGNERPKKLIGEAAKTEILMKKIEAAWKTVAEKKAKAAELVAKKKGIAKFFEEHSSTIGQAALYFFGVMTGSVPFLALGAVTTHIASDQEKQVLSPDKKPK